MRYEGGRHSALRRLLGAVAVIGLFAQIAGAQAQNYQQVDSLLLKFYPDLPLACGDAQQALHARIANGSVAVAPSHEAGASSVVYRRTDGAMTFMLGSAGCRIGAALGKDIRSAASGGTGANPATEWATVPRVPDDPALTQTHYDAHNPACESADLYLHLQAGVALVRLASRRTADRQSDGAGDGLQSPTGPLRGTIGRRGCEIGLLVFRAD